MSMDVEDRPEVKHARWAVVVWYRTDSGPVDVHHDLEELAELHDLIEAGPSWQAIDHIDIQYRGLPEKLTIEETKNL